MTPEDGDGASQRGIAQASEREQRRIGRQLHDTLCQSLSGISILVRLLARRAAAGEVLHADNLGELGDMIDHALQEARNLSRRLHPVAQESFGLMAALEALGESSSSSISCDFRCDKPVLINEPKVAVAIYRIAEEAVVNALEHSRADRITISLQEIQGAVALEVHDDGCGFTQVETQSVTGLALMRSRATSIGAELRIQSQANDGTTVCCTWRCRS